jgi:hypothetical protein
MATVSVNMILLLGVFFLVGALLQGGIYTMVPAGSAEPGSAQAYRLNRFTGQMFVCQSGVCLPVEMREAQRR